MEKASIMFTTRPIQPREFNQLIAFDQKALIEDTGISHDYGPPPLTVEELEHAHKYNILEWVVVHDVLAGYFWLENRNDHFFISGLAVMPEHYGSGLAQMILHLVDEKAKTLGLNIIKLAVMPENGRAINAYFKFGYQITAYNPDYFGSQYPNKFRLIMEKRLDLPPPNLLADRCEIVCTNREAHKKVIDNGYVGIGIKRGDEAFNHFIIFRHQA
jgi:ribosomal protein S18 acetylase RimI-like enzyme